MCNVDREKLPGCAVACSGHYVQMPVVHAMIFCVGCFSPIDPTLFSQEP